MRTLVLTTLLAILGLTQLSAQAWIQKQTFTGAARYGAVGFSLFDKGYVTLGDNGTNYLTDLWEYDPVTDAWTQKARFPGNPRRVPIVVTTDSLAYVGGGWDGTFGYIDWYEYNPLNDTWTQKTNYQGPNGRNLFGASVDNKGYVGGGAYGPSGSFSDQFWQYNPDIDFWLQRPSLPFGPRGAGIACGLDGLIFLGMGQDGTQDFNDLWAYNPVVNSWVQRANFPGVGRIQARCMIHHDKLVVGGGYELGIGAELSDYYEYDPQNDTWTPFPTFAAGARSVSAVFSIDGQPYISTGWDANQNEMNDLWTFDDNAVSRGEPIVATIPVLVSPNPAIHQVQIQHPAIPSGGTFSLFDAMGREILQQPIEAAKTHTTVEVSELPSGMYFYQMQTAQGQATGRLQRR